MTEVKIGKAPRHITQKDKDEYLATKKDKAPKSNVVIEQDETQMDLEETIATSTQQMAEHTTQIMNTFGDGLVYERNRIVGEARFFMAQSADAMLEAGKRLIVLKENEPHGEFAEILVSQLGIETRIAQKMMQAALKFLSPKLGSNAKSISHLGKTKLYDLMLLDDDSIVELTEGGTVAGLTLDKIESMSCGELRKALREAREDITAKNEVIADKSGKIDELSTSLRKIKRISADNQILNARKEVASLEGEVEERIRVQLRSAFNELQDLAGHTGTHDHIDFISSQLDLLDRALLQLRAELGIERTQLTTAPDWENDQ